MLKAAEAAVTNLDAQVVVAAVDHRARQGPRSMPRRASLTFATVRCGRHARRPITNGAGTQSRAEQSQSLKDQAAASGRARSGRAGCRAEQGSGAYRPSATRPLGASATRAARRCQPGRAQPFLYEYRCAAVDGTVGARSIRVGQYRAHRHPTDGGGAASRGLYRRQLQGNAADLRTPGPDRGDQGRQLPGCRRSRGHVDSVSPASGLEFSLLPPDNATGNFTKIVQRIPVKIVIDDETPCRPLRSGMSVNPDIDTKAAADLRRPRRRAIIQPAG